MFRYYTPSENFPRFMNALRYLIKCSSIDRAKRALGYEDLELSSEDERLSRLVFRVSYLEQLCSSLES